MGPRLEARILLRVSLPLVPEEEAPKLRCGAEDKAGLWDSSLQLQMKSSSQGLQEASVKDKFHHILVLKSCVCTS